MRAPRWAKADALFFCRGPVRRAARRALLPVGAAGHRIGIQRLRRDPVEFWRQPFVQQERLGPLPAGDRRDADALRQQILAQGWNVLDTADGPQLEAIALEA